MSFLLFSMTREFYYFFISITTGIQ